MRFVAPLLGALGVGYNRMNDNVVLFAMTLRGRMPWVAPESCAPSIVAWGSIGLIAATMLLQMNAISARAFHFSHAHVS